MKHLVFFEEIRDKVNIIETISQHVALKRNGPRYNAICPFHQEKTPSFSVNPIRRYYYCFGCGAHGDVIKFFATINNLSYKEAANSLAKRYGILSDEFNHKVTEEEKELIQIRKVLTLAANFFIQNISQTTVEYLNNRGLNSAQINKFSLGFAPDNHSLENFMQQNNIPLFLLQKAGLFGKHNDSGRSYEIFKNRIIFPIQDLYGQIIGFGGRAIHDRMMPKYLNSPETLIFKKSSTLYLEHIAVNSNRNSKFIILVEGYIDAIRMHLAGIENTVAVLGTAVSENHLLKLWKYTQEILICFDGDKAGLAALYKTIILALPYLSIENTVSAILLPDNFDPDQFICRYGQEKMQAIIQERMSLSQIIWKIYTQEKIFDTAEKRVKLESDLKNLCDKIRDPLISKNYRLFFKDQLFELSRSYRVRNFPSYGTQRVKDDPIILIKRSLELIKTSDDGFNLLTNPLYNIEYNILYLFFANPFLIRNSEIEEHFWHISIFSQPLIPFKQYIEENIEIFKCFEEQQDYTSLESKFKQLKSLAGQYLQLHIDNLEIDKLPIFMLTLFKERHLVILSQERDEIPKTPANMVRIMSYAYEILSLQRELNQLKQKYI